MNDLIPDFSSLQELSPPALLVVFLNVIGFVIRKSSLDNKYIPVILMVLGAVAYNFVGVKLVKPDDRFPHVTLTMLGAIIGFASVGVNQAIRQFKPLKTLYEDTPTPTSSPDSKS